MKAAVLYDKEDLRIEDVNIPRIDDFEVLIKTKVCGVCGTDASMYSGKYLPIKPVIPGHEFSGEVVKVGEEVKTIKVGDRVIADENVACGVCYWCKKQQKLFCPEMYQIGIHSDGGFAEYFKAPERNVFKLPNDLSYKHAAFTEPLACVTRVVDRAEIVTGDTVVVIGDGPIGLSCTQVAKINGASRVIVIGLTDYRLEKASEIGVDLTVNSSKENPSEVVKNATGGVGADVVIEAVGKSITYKKAIDLVRRGGNVAVMGVPSAEDRMELSPFNQIFNKELTLHASFAGTYDTWIRALSLISSGRFKVDPLITHRTSLEDLPKAINLVRNIEDNVIKVIASPDYDKLSKCIGREGSVGK